jgi:hypothetical protein
MASVDAVSGHTVPLTFLSLYSGIGGITSLGFAFGSKNLLAF